MNEAKFKDTEGRDWSLRLDVATLRRVRDLTSVDLGKLFSDPQQLANLHADIILFVDVLFAIVKPTADARGVSDIQFGQSLAGDVLESAVLAFETSVVDFLPERDRRAVLRQLIDGNRAAQKQAVLRIQNAIRDGLIEQGISEQMATLDQMLSPRSGKSSTDSPQSSASSLVPTPSAS
jgi:hypothetical protein